MEYKFDTKIASILPNWLAVVGKYKSTRALFSPMYCLTTILVINLSIKILGVYIPKERLQGLEPFLIPFLGGMDEIVEKRLVDFAVRF